MNTKFSLEEVRNQLSDTLASNRGCGHSYRRLDISPWAAMSLMQKAIRRDCKDLALAAARTLLEDSPERLWRRLSVTAFEDVGAADIAIVASVVAGLKGKHWRAKVGGEWQVANHLVLLMCAAPKCRGADDLAMICEHHPSLSRERQLYASEPPSELLKILRSDEPLTRRALALWYAFGTYRCRSDNLLQRRSDYQALLKELPGMGFEPLLVELAAEGLKKGGEILAVFTMFLGEQRECGEPRLVDDRFPEEALIAGIPGWVFDKHVREGNTAMRHFMEVDCETTRWLSQYVPKEKRGEILKYLVFNIESGLVKRRFRWGIGDRLRASADCECYGIDPKSVREAHELMRGDIPILNDMRHRALNGGE